MIWCDVCIVIPSLLSAPGRPDSLRDLIHALAQQCSGAIVRVLPQWRDTVQLPEVQATLAAGLRGITRPLVLWLEDDVTLCHDFGARARQAIDAHVSPTAVLSLFSPAPLPPGLHELRQIVGCQAVAVTAGIAELWSAEILNLRDAPKGLGAAPEHALTVACRDRGFRLQTITPSLVQHKHLPSTYGFTVSASSPTFER